MALGAPSAVKRRASPSFCASTSAKRLNSGRGKARIAPPAAERALRHARVDERQRNAAGRAFQDQVGPDLRFGEHGQVGPPVVEEAAPRTRAHRAARTDAWRAGPSRCGGELGRGHGAGGEQERQRRALLAPARPSAAGWRWSRRRWRRGTRRAGPAGRATLGRPEPLAAPRRLLLAAPLAQAAAACGATGRARLVSVR